ncbi:transposable element Tcb1 transposase [Trichonephila clavipes]|nr:transposable element Tcb1 transposase [Trichonephila clavipes]
MDRVATSRTLAQWIQSATHHSVSARTIRRRLQKNGMSARHPLLRLPLPGNHRRLHHQCACHQPYSNRIRRDHTWHVMSKTVRNVRSHQTDLRPWLARFPSPLSIENVWSMLAQRLVRDASSTAAPDQLWQYVEAAWTAVLQGYI